VTPEDLKGIKLRVPGNPYSLETFKALGANPTPMDANVLYLALREGVVDGQENPLASIWSLKYHEVQKYISLSNHVFSPIFIGVSLRYWNRWPPEVQKAVREAAEAACDYSFEQDAKSETAMKSRILAANPGLKFNTVDTAAFEKAAEPLIAARRGTIDPEVWNRAMAALDTYKNVALKSP
jgi:TRAP-type C4-dicarboxylate transport system substrate-binding protein